MRVTDSFFLYMDYGLEFLLSCAWTEATQKGRPDSELGYFPSNFLYTSAAREPHEHSPGYETFFSK